jgi:thioredoxin-like negative regulator of GroEL
MIGPLLGLVLLAAPGAPEPTPGPGAYPPQEIPWEKDWGVAMKKARAAGKPILVDFWATWCGWCAKLDATTYRDPKVVKLAAEFIPVKINSEGSRAEVQVALKYGVSSLPTVAFVSPSGRPIVVMQGFQGPGQFAGSLEKAREASQRVLGLEAALDKNGDDAAALLELGLHLLDNDDYDGARELLGRVRTVDSDRPVADRKQARMLLGTLEYYDNKYTKAEQVLKEGLNLRPETEFDPKLMYVLSKVYIKANRKAEARTLLQTLLESYASTPIAQKAKETLVALDGQR